MKNLLRELLQFCKGHWHVFLAAPFMAIAYTIVHEAAHGAAVIAQGGTITEFVYLPNAGLWGHVSYIFPAETEYSSFAISIAPYCLSLTISSIGLLLAHRKKPYPYFLASVIFIWMYVAPLADIGYAAFPWLAGKPNDFLSAFGPPNSIDRFLVNTSAAIFASIGYLIQKKLYRQKALSPLPYIILSLAIITAITVLTGSFGY